MTRINFNSSPSFQILILYWSRSMNPLTLADFCIVIINKISNKNSLPFAIGDLFMQDNGNDDGIENEYDVAF